jgi:hypothetical protein
MNPLETVLHDLSEITDAQIDHCRLNFPSPEDGEEAICVITDREVFRMWALTLEYERRAALAVHAAKFDAYTPEHVTKLLVEAGHWHMLRDITKAAGWFMVKELGGQKAWESPSVAIRSGFVLVVAGSDTKPLEDMVNRIKEAVSHLMEQAEDDPEPEDDPAQRARTNARVLMRKAGINTGPNKRKPH